MSQAQQTSAPHLSVVIPAYNEETRLGESLRRVLAYLAAQSYDWEVIVVDDGSADATGRVSEEIGRGRACRVLRNEPNRGKGYSIRRGMLEARGRYRLFSDADLSTPIEELDKFWPAVNDGYGMVIGSRALPDSNLEVRQPFYREMMGRVFNLFVRLLLVGGIRDTQCGFKLFTAEMAESIFPRQTLQGFAFDVELIVLARRAGFKVAEVPVRWINSPASRVSAWRDSAKMFLDLLRLKFQRTK
ncbi:MAG: glycosyltransferase family 2 protein [Candidatus Sumerlaeota bacterium]|nr:glycosyltransferase family 2 protein [Candidatus Sumerlaeota bacterium]